MVNKFILLFALGSLAAGMSLGLAQGKPGEGFPEGHYTPFGYLDIPFHSLWEYNAGLVRSLPPAGFRFRQHGVKVSLSCQVQQTVLCTSEHFARAGLHASYHSKNIFTYRWQWDQVDFQATYFLATDRGEVLHTRLAIENRGTRPARVALCYTLSLPRLEIDHYLGLGQDREGFLLRVYAAGPVYLVRATRLADESGVTRHPALLDAFRNFASPVQLDSHTVNVEGDFLAGGLRWMFLLQPGEQVHWLVSCARAEARGRAEQRVQQAIEQASVRLERLRQADDRFWAACPRLLGDWPQTWKNGWVYDWETLRMMVRPPMGVYRHPWDGMALAIPRSVLAETAIDMWTLSYAEPELAKQVYYGIFADALAPNLPCMRENGSVNMVSESGEECGTAPSWCMPSMALRSVLARTGDERWARQMLPHIEAFVQWWLQHRRAADGGFFFDNSWESGQDQSARFQIVQRTGGASIRFIEPVDLTASMVDFAVLLIQWQRSLGKKPPEQWSSLRSALVRRLKNFWTADGFRDRDRRTGRFTRSAEPYLLMPFALGLADRESLRWLANRISDRQWRARFDSWCRSAPGLQVVAEALWQSGHRLEAARLVGKIASRVYRWWDRRTWATPEVLPAAWGHIDRPAIRLEYHPRTWQRETGDIDSSTNPRAAPRQKSLPMPGVACEFWGDDSLPPGGMEAYGWGATLPLHIIRNIIGYREDEQPESEAFLLAPAIPDPLYQLDKALGIGGLHFRELDFDLWIRMRPAQELEVQLNWRARQPRRLLVDVGKKRIAGALLPHGSLSFTIPNGTLCRVQVASG